MLNYFVTREMRYIILGTPRAQTLPGPQMHQRSRDRAQQLLERGAAVASYSLKLVSERLWMSVSSRYLSPGTFKWGLDTGFGGSRLSN